MTLAKDRPQADGTYPYDGFRWGNYQNLGTDTEKNGPAQKAAEKLCGFNLTGWLNKAFLVYKVEGGVAYAVYLSDWSWRIITTSKPEVIAEVKARRQANLDDVARSYNLETSRGKAGDLLDYLRAQVVLAQDLLNRLG